MTTQSDLDLAILSLHAYNLGHSPHIAAVAALA